IFNDHGYSINQLIVQVTLLRGYFWVPSLDGLSWTLEIELTFYLLTAIFMSIDKVIKKRVSIKLFVVLSPLLSAVCIDAVNHTGGIVQTSLMYLSYVIPFLLFMYAGTFIYYFVTKHETFGSTVLFVFYLIWAFQVCAKAHPALSNFDFSSYLVALTIFLAFFISRDTFPKYRLLQYFASISYPLYAVHALLGYSLMYCFHTINVSAYYSIILTFISVLFVSIVIHKLVEKPSLRVIKFIKANSKSD
uniref:acyltransferase family protein n=1 Tax=Vibrio ordalii TaxID=28174 RepID=UPI000377D523